ncbi:unnamed protein product [Triticum turgidum subsp. durum]|uniref:AAA+ ATPase domain-containing protein n=1 Tax=Triticum turgidum subsp. durum TaxID=4567 RepID=A0A9R0WY91_TRITD|nr:unnamed protein product [Triticum turgidum subsp. durum]
MAGVSAGTGAMSSLLGKLSALLTHEYKLLKGVRKEIQFLERELGRMRAYLDILADMDKLDDLAKKRRDSLRDLSYEMEDCIDRFMDRLGTGDARRGFMRTTARRLRTIWARHDIATLIRDLKARVLQETELHDSATRPVEIDPRMTALHEEVKGLVAMDAPAKHISALLMDQSMELKVVPIVGPGGLGKSTLAMEVYRKIGRHFRCRASVSVSRALDLDKFLKDILSQIDESRECQPQGSDIQLLIRKTTQILTGKRYFIVIDDIWKEHDWKLVKAAFPENNNGSRIIATTRITGVANLCCSRSGGLPYQMEPLDDVGSRRLFFKRIFSSDDPCPAELEEVSTRILKKCGGVPLAIITFASLLANKTHNNGEWERLQDTIGTGSSLDNNETFKGMRQILLLSYLDLPRHLKTCLLYLCIYPEDYEIECEELKWKWMAEGFIATQWGRLDQVAENCFNELVNRNMIQPVDVGYDGSVKRCRVHDMVLDLVISLSDEENFATVLNGRICNSFSSKIRRLSMQSSAKEQDEAVRAITETKLHVRSLSMFGQVKQICHLVDFHALRVLDLVGCEWLENKHVKNIGSSCQLRYLRLSSFKITELPGEIGKLQHLETLDVRGCYYLPRLPSTVVQLQKLVRLLVSRRTELPASEFGSMQALEELEKLNIWNSDNPLRFAEELGHLTKLRRVDIHLNLNLNEKLIMDYATRERLVELLVSSLSELGKCNLRYLSIGGDLCNRLFWDPCCTYPYLHDLTIGPAIKTVTKGMASLKNLVKLCIAVEEFDKEGLHLLMGMPFLAHLELAIRISIKEKLNIGTNGFKLLKVFHFTYMTDRWYSKVEAIDRLQLTFATGAMPALRQFHLELNPMEVTSNFFADLGIEHFSGLAHFQVEIDCNGAAPGWVEALESSIEKATDLHPNNEMEIHLSRLHEDGMFKDDKEWEEAAAKERKKERNEEEGRTS